MSPTSAFYYSSAPNRSRMVDHYNHKRLHSAIGYIAPADKLHGRDTLILQERTRKPTEAQLRRAQTAQQEEVKQVAVL